MFWILTIKLCDHLSHYSLRLWFECEYKFAMDKIESSCWLTWCSNLNVHQNTVWRTIFCSCKNCTWLTYEVKSTLWSAVSLVVVFRDNTKNFMFHAPSAIILMFRSWSLKNSYLLAPCTTQQSNTLMVHWKFWSTSGSDSMNWVLLKFFHIRWQVLLSLFLCKDFLLSVVDCFLFQSPVKCNNFIT